jgi:sugar (pentulose or hexulose) kinase
LDEQLEEVMTSTIFIVGGAAGIATLFAVMASIINRKLDKLADSE